MLLAYYEGVSVMLVSDKILKFCLNFWTKRFIIGLLLLMELGEVKGAADLFRVFSYSATRAFDMYLEAFALF